MLELFMYPVSAVMKAWHILLTSGLGINDSTAWALSLFGLVVTVRAIIAPFSWMQLKAGRITVLMRPKLRKLEKEYEKNPNADTLEHYQQRQKEIREEYGYNMSAGCVPALIQIPTFLGLYQVLLRMARPAEGLDSQVHAPIGMLSGGDVTSFLQSRIADIPLPAYSKLGDAELAHLGTTAQAVHDFTLPFVLAACVFTFLNMVMSVIRNGYSLDRDSKLAIRLNRFLLAMILLAPWAIYNGGVNGPIPVAIVLYWVANNLWTLIQNAILYTGIRLKYPYDEDYLEFQRERKAAIKQAKVESKQEDKLLKQLKRKARRDEAAKEEYEELLAKRKQAQEDAKALRKQKSTAMRELSARRREETAKEKAGKDPQPSQDEEEA